MYFFRLNTGNAEIQNQKNKYKALSTRNEGPVPFGRRYIILAKMLDEADPESFGQEYVLQARKQKDENTWSILR